MKDNPYAPPVAPVYDVTPSEQVRARPREVVLAVQLAAGGYLLGLAVFAASWSYYSRLQSPAQLVMSQTFTLILLAWLYYKVYRGRNWARITLLVFFLFGSLFIFNRTFLNIISATPALAKANMILGTVINIAVLWLLFFSPGREWFRKR
jgi:hypothetical protein